MLYKINEEIERVSKQILKDVSGLIAIPSISTNKVEVKNALNMVIQKAKSMGFEAKTVLDDQVGIVEMGKGDETLGILVHVDVVDEGDLNQWEFDPFGGKIIAGYICGRGAIDDKGPVIASLYAMKVIKDLNIPMYKKVQLIIGTQEEVEWTDINQYVKEYELPDYGFTPDGEFPITNIEKGYIDIKINFNKPNLDESEGIEILSIYGGSMINTIPGECKVKLKGDINYIKERIESYRKLFDDENITVMQEEEYILVIANGIATHSCFPDKGKNAISILCNFLNQINLKENQFKKMVNFISKYFSEDTYLKELGLYTKNQYYNGEFIHRTVGSPTIIKTEENISSIMFNFRTAYGTQIEDVINVLDEIKNEYDFNVELLEGFNPTYVSKESGFLDVFAKSYEEITGNKNEFTLAYGSSYAKAMQNIVSWGPIFPGEEDTCHEANEKISIDSLINATKIYANAIYNVVHCKET